MKVRKIISLLIIVISVFCLSGCKDSSAYVFDSKNKMEVHYLDVGQGDATLIILPNQEVMLIDAGERSKGAFVREYIEDLGIRKIDYLVGTHPHTDHIGGLEEVINNFDIGSIYMPRASSTSKTFESLLNTINEKNLKVKSAKSGVNIIDEDGLKIDIVAPNSVKYSSLNNYSAVIKITYKNNKFLFMGDAEEVSEKEIKEDVSADVIKIGHHGSNTSSSKEFIARVKPKYAIISVGDGNKYNHPSKDVLKTLEDIGASVYRTDILGTIVISSDGSNIIKFEDGGK